MNKNPSPGTEASFFLQDAQVHLIHRLGTNSMPDIFKIDEADYNALRILDALAMLCLYGPERPPYHLPHSTEDPW